jgi:NAD(P)-dependent dehydrogenase (short-subunit alcohol dehydrogenase family)
MIKDEPSFEDKICIVTGGGSGIGRATCKMFAARGAKVIIVDNDETTGRDTASLIAADNKEAFFFRTDVSASAEVKTLIDTVIKRWQRIDILVNNAGIMTFKSVIDLDEAEWDRVIEVNLKAVFLFCKYSLPHIKNGAIINVSSVHAHQTDSNVSAYAASKGGIEAFTRALSREHKPENIRINCVAPGGVDTPLLWSNPVIKKLKREDVAFCSPDKIASIICFLASEEASAIHGTTVVADLGLLSAL